MKLLVDQNLPRRLVEVLQREFPGSKHVRDLGLDQVDDGVLWKLAADQGFTIVSEDSDFRQRVFLYGPPPKVVWVRVGNCPTKTVLGIVQRRLADLLAFSADAGSGLLVIG